jgi:hypothetical protein
VNDPQKKAYDLATEVTKQLLTLSSGTLVFAATLLRDQAAHGMIRVAIVACYIALFISILSGIKVLYVITVMLASIKSNDDNEVPKITCNPAIRKAALIQQASFMTGLVLLSIFGLSQFFLSK